MEKALETVLAKYPELVEDGLCLIGRQMEVCGRRIDLLFKDTHQRQLLVELKWGPIRDEHIGQIMHYAGGVLAHDRPDLRVMLIGTRVPPNLRTSLDYHGMAWKEISQATVLAFLRGKQDQELVREFENEVESMVERARAAKVRTAKSVGNPALLVPIEKTEWLQQACDELAGGKDHIQFGTNSLLQSASKLPISAGLRAYFKVKGDPRVVGVATLVDITQEHRPDNRLGGRQNVQTWKWYYGFRALVLLPEPIPVSYLRYYQTGNVVPNCFPGPCVVEEFTAEPDEVKRQDQLGIAA